MSEPKYTRLGQDLKALRGDLSLRKQAERFGVNHQRIILWEKGANKPTQRYRAMWEQLYPWVAFDWTPDAQEMTPEEAAADQDMERYMDGMAA